MSRITTEEVRELAVLSRLALSEEEIARMTGDLDAILDYVDAMRELDTTGVEPMTHAVPFDCPTRPDEIAPSYVFFASEQLSSYYTGEVMAAIGGETTPGG